MAEQNPSITFSALEAEGGLQGYAVSGRLDAESLDSALEQVGAFLKARGGGDLVLDLSGVTYLDSAGGLALSLMRKMAAQAGRGISFINLTPQAESISELIDAKALDKKPLIPEFKRRNFISALGASAKALSADSVEIITFLGRFYRSCLGILAHPRRIRWGEVWIALEKVGVDGLPIVGLVGFLMGLILAFMSSLQLKNFGADIYVASLVSLGMVRELGPIVASILAAGRSGSAFAAEIGTMRVNEEVDALEVMGFDTMAFLTMPKVVASVVVIPLLVLYCDLTAILGGMVVGVAGLDLTVTTYINESMSVITPFGIISSYIKSMFFAMIIAGVGCQRGFMVRGGASSVGQAATSAVVTSMFLIIVADSVFAVLLYYVW